VANVTAKDLQGWIALHWAAKNGHVGVMRLLLEIGADINSMDLCRKTALH
jgi:ankyrin repeat protein